MQSHRSRRVALRISLLLLAGVVAGPAGAQPLDTAWVWTLPGGRPGAAGLVLSNFDGDLRDELHLVSAGDYVGYDARADYWSAWRLAAGTVRQDWSSLPIEDGIQALAASPAPENRFVLASGTTIQVFDGIDRSLERTIDTDYQAVAGLLVDDLDGDGDLEIAVCDSSNLYVLSFDSGVELGRRYGFGCTALVSGQLDPDLARELVIAGNPAGGIVLDGASLAVEWVDLGGFDLDVAVTDADGDGLDDIVTRRAQTSKIEALEPGTGFVHWELDSSSSGLLESADVDGDGDREILAEDDYYLGGIAALDETSGVVLWSVPYGYEFGYPVAAGLGDLDGDGALDLAVGMSSGDDRDGSILVFDVLTQSLVASTPRLGIRVVDLALGDLNDDANVDLLAAFSGESWSDEARLASFDLSTRSTTWIEPENPDAIEVLAVAVGQADLDAAAEFCATRSDWDFVTVECFDGSSHELEWALALEELTGSPGLDLLSLDGSGPDEVLAATPGAYLYAFEGPTGWLRWRSPSVPYWSEGFAQIRVADLDANAQAEVVAGGGWFDGISALTLFDAATGAPIAGPHELDLVAFEIGQLDADPMLELVASLGSYESDLVEIDPWSGTASAPIASFGGSVTTVRLAEMTGDTQPDYVLLVESTIVILDGTDASLAWQSPFLGPGAAGSERIHLLELGGDSRPEIVVNLGRGFAVFGDAVFSAFADGFESGDCSEWSLVVPWTP